MLDFFFRVVGVGFFCALEMMLLFLFFFRYGASFFIFLPVCLTRHLFLAFHVVSQPPPPAFPFGLVVVW